MGTLVNLISHLTQTASICCKRLGGLRLLLQRACSCWLLASSWFHRDRGKRRRRRHGDWRVYMGLKDRRNHSLKGTLEATGEDTDNST